MKLRPLAAAVLTGLIAVALTFGACGRPAAPTPTSAPTAAPPVATTRPAPTATATLAPSPTPAPPTPTFTVAPTPTSTPVLSLLERLPTGKNQDFVLTLTDADLSELVALATKDSVDPEIYWPEAHIHPDEIVINARLVATGRALVIDAEVHGNIVLQSGIPRYKLSDMKTWILCYFCFEVVNGEPRLRITPAPTSAGEAPRDLLDPSTIAQIGGGANWYAMAEGMVNNALWYVDPARPKSVNLGDFVITEFKQEEGLLTLRGRTK